MREYKLVSGDGHVNEPPNVWIDRLPQKYQERAPKMQRFEQGHAWVFEGATNPINFGFNASAGLPPGKNGPWIFWEKVEKRSYDPHARVQALDQGNVDAELMYSTPRIAGALCAGNKDREFHLACIRAYNDWLSDFCSKYPDRLYGLALMPTTGVEDALAEFNRAMKLPSMKSPYLGMWPNGQSTLGTEDERFWAAVRELGVPVSVHVSINTAPRQVSDGDPNRARIGTKGETRGISSGTATNCLELIQSGAFDRFPNLKIVFAECETSWVPIAKQTMDDRYKRYGSTTHKEKPSYYFDRNIFTTFVIDPYAVRNRDLVGVSQMMWSNDLFHAVCEWPNDWKIIERDFKGVPENEKHAILAGNVVREYKLK